MKLSRLICAGTLAVFVGALSHFAAAVGAIGPGGGSASAGLYAGNPPLVVQGADPFLMIDLSVELTQQAEAYTDGLQQYANGTTCPGRLGGQVTPWGTKEFGICYSASERYIGYFDSEKCYVYDTTTYSNTNIDQLPTGPRVDAYPFFFKPTSKAVNHACSGAFSGNFLNWSTMTALDEFRYAMTGGARSVDKLNESMLIRTRRFDSWPFVYKAISGAGLSFTNTSVTPNITNTFTTNPSTVTPFTSSDLAMPSTAGTVACACNVSGSPSKCTKPSSSSQNPTACTCTQASATSYVPSNKLLVINDWSGLGVGQSNHKTRFYTYGTGTTTISSTKLTTYTRSGYTCPSNVAGVGTPGSSTGVVAKLLPVNGKPEVNVIVKVCNPAATSDTKPTGDEVALCSGHVNGATTYYKPEGLLQKNALKMSYALTSYTGRSGNVINGGVLRANAKYVGNQMPTSNGGLQNNPNKEVDSDGFFQFDPDNLTLAKSGTVKVGVNGVQPINSGIINYINQFGLFAGAYKGNDPDAELYYEGLRYLMHLGPTNSFWNPVSNGGVLTAAEQDGFPVFGASTAGSPAWSDPVTSSCQKNFAMYVGDKNPHRNDYLPGGYSLGADDPACTAECADALAKGINTGALEDTLGAAEGGISKATNRGRNDGYGLAGMAWWANTHDIRTDKAGDQRLKTFIVDTQEYSTGNPVGKSNALLVAAKWGGFEDSTGNNVATPAPQPDLVSEWNSRGGVFTDGTKLPDTYTLASQPANLLSGLTQIFAAAASGSSSSSAAAVVANNAYSVATVYQALYEPQLSSGGTGVVWTGLVRAFFLDDVAQTREDTDGDGKLTNADYVVKYKPDPSNSGATVADLYKVDGTLMQSNVAIRNLKPIWNASAQLSALSAGSIANQRTYTASAATGRYIRTWIDIDGDGVVDAGEEIDFTASNFPVIGASSNDATLDYARFLGLDSSNGTQAGNIVNYIRGQEIAGLRNRTIDLNDGLGSLTRRLGDIVHSAPLVVGAPQQNYDVDFSDATYGVFKTQYANRRSVVYAGANDGMLHAFNAGFFNPVTKSYLTADTQPLGGELWAYVPQGLLPHLRWLTDPLYQHIFYVDGSPQSFDVNIFSPDADHPGGWGTILVVGFRLGGGEITINSTTDQAGASDPGNTVLRPAYVVMDVTNPDKPPKLLAEISHPLMGFTISQPAVVKHRALSGSSVTANQWYLVMGSGPIGTDSASDQIAHDKAVSYRPAQIFGYDLNALSFSGVYPVSAALETSSFVGHMAAMDWNKDYTDDVIYFGTVGGTDTANPMGNLWRLVIPADYTTAPSVSLLLTNNGGNQPFSAPPLPAFDKFNRPWVYAGAGRFYTSSDVLSTKQMTYYGIKESSDLTVSISKTNLANTTGLRVATTTGIVADAGNNTPVTVNGLSVSSFPQLTAAVDTGSGWYFDLDTLPVSGRDVDRTLQFKESLVFIEYLASNDSCLPAGNSALFAPNMLTGTASPFATLGASATQHVGSTAIAASLSKSLGAGQSFISGLYAPAPVGGSVSSTSCHAYLIYQNSGGGGGSEDLNCPNWPAGHGRMSWRELPTQ